MTSGEVATKAAFVRQALDELARLPHLLAILIAAATAPSCGGARSRVRRLVPTRPSESTCPHHGERRAP